MRSAIAGMLSSRVWSATVTAPLRHNAGICSAYRRAEASRPGINTTARGSITGTSVTCSHETPHRARAACSGPAARGRGVRAYTYDVARRRRSCALRGAGAQVPAPGISQPHLAYPRRGRGRACATPADAGVLWLLRLALGGARPLAAGAADPAVPRG